VAAAEEEARRLRRRAAAAEAELAAMRDAADHFAAGAGGDGRAPDDAVDGNPAPAAGEVSMTAAAAAAATAAAAAAAGLRERLEAVTAEAEQVRAGGRRISWAWGGV
jgi:hypothetical protein